MTAKGHIDRRLLVGLTMAAAAGLGAYGFATGAGLTALYLGFVGLLGVVVWRADRRVGLSDLVAVGLTAWAVAHLAGGLVALSGDRVLYNAVLLPHLRFDNIVHFFGFGVGGIAAWEVFSFSLGSDVRVTPRAAGSAVWLFGMGLGAANEVVEFLIAINVEDTNVGGFLNTGRDLVANLLGSALAGLLVARRQGRPAAHDPSRAT